MNTSTVSRYSGTATSSNREKAPCSSSQLPMKLAPMLATLGDLPAREEEYAYEIKWDGIRALTHIRNGSLQILSRNCRDITSQYPELQALADEFPSRELVLDGEIVVMGEDGQPSFSRLQHRMHVGSSREVERRMAVHPATYVIFDVLYVDGASTFRLPYSERRRILDGLELTGMAWLTPPAFTVDGEAILQACRHRKLEGVVAKRLDSPYSPGTRTGAWIKIKVRPRQELVIGGWTPGKGSRSSTLGSLLVGYYDVTAQEALERGKPQQLIFAGKVGAGYTDPVLRQLTAELRDLERRTSPFAGAVPSEAVFVEPFLVGEFEFAEWTPALTLRQPSFKGLRRDKDPSLVLRE